MKKFLIILTFLLSFSIHAYAKTLWQSTQTGMTVNQVHRIFPDANLKLASAETTLSDGAKKLLEIKTYRIGIHDYQVGFYFKDNGLSQVTLSLLDGQYALGAYQSLVDAFRVKYGQETTSSEGKISSQKIWITKEQANIRLLMISSVVFVFYGSSDYLDLDKL